MGVRLTGYGFAEQGGVRYNARIYDTAFSGSSTDVSVVHGGIKIAYTTDKRNDRHAAIFGSEASVLLSVAVGDSTVETFLEDLRTAPEGQFWLEITKTLVDLVVWRGVIVADNCYETDKGARFEANISAVDGLALLKERPYLNGGTAIYTGFNKLTRHLTRCLEQLPHIAWWGGSDPILETSVDWWGDSMTSGGANDPLHLSNADHSTFYDYFTKGTVDNDALSCYDVIWHIVQSFGCRIYQYRGVFVVEQIPYRSSSSYEFRRYDKSGNFLTSSVRSGTNDIINTAAGAKISYVTYDYIPQLQKALVTYDAKLRRNFWGNIILAESVTYNFDQEISSNSGEATFRIRGTFNVNVKNNSYSGNPQDILFAEMQIFLKVGSNYLKRTGTYANFAWHPNPASWTASASDKCSVVSSGQQVAASGVSNSYIFSFDFITPPLPSDGSDNALSATFFQLKRNNNEDVTEGEFTITWTAGGLYMEVYDQGTPDVSEDEILYETSNPDDGTDNWETTIRLGGGGNNYAGRLFTDAGVNIAQWGEGAGTRDKALGALLAQVVMNGQLRAIKRMQGQLYGELEPHLMVVTTDGLNWLPMTLEWSPTESILAGTWFEVDYGTAGVNSTPIKKKFKTLGGQWTPGPVLGGISNGSQGFATNNSPGIALSPIAFNAIDTPISEGATITTLDLVDPATGSEFITGDTVTLVHPITLQFQNFIVNPAPGLGDTSISVDSQTALFDAPVGAFLVVKQKAFAFALPPATTGQILVFDGASWVPYTGTTQHDVFAQTTNFTSGTVVLTLTQTPLFGINFVDYNGRILRNTQQYTYSAGAVTILFDDPDVTSYDTVPYFQVSYNRV